MKKLTDSLPFWHFDESQDLMIFKDGSLGAGFKLTGFDLNCTPSEEINRFTKNIENLLTTFEEGYRLQVYYKLSPDVSELIETNKGLSEGCSEEYEAVRGARYNFLKENESEKNYFVPEIYFFVRSKSYPYQKSGVFDKNKDYRSVTKKEYDSYREKFRRVLRQVESIFISSKVDPERISCKEWFSLCFRQLNLERSEKLGVPKYSSIEEIFSEPLCSQLFLTDIFSDKNAIQIGDYFFKVITLKSLPEGQTSAAMIDEFTKMPFHFWISQNIKVLNQGAEKNKLQLQRRIAHSMATGSKNVSDLESESKLSNIEDLLSELLEGSQKLISMDFNVIVWGESLEDVEENCDEILKMFRDMGQAEGLIETLPSMEAFLKSMPGTCEGFRHKRMKSSNAAHLLPLYSYWEGNKVEPVCLIPNRDYGICSISPFSKSLMNWNGVVVGSSGAGKSFTVTSLMLMFCGLAGPTGKFPRIVWIDNGASSKGLIECLGGEFLDLKVDSGISINLFDLPEKETAPTPGKVRLILAILEVILKDDDQKGLPKRHKALLEEAIFKTYESVSDRLPTLSDLRDLLRDHNQEDMRLYAETLFSWCGNSAYGQVLDRQTNVKLSKDLVSIEVQSLNTHPELKDVLLLLLTSHIEDTSIADFERPYLLIVDEAERLFQTELAKQFVITCYRTWRKFNSGIWCLSQNYKDFLSDKSLADSLLPNTSHLIILRQKKIDWKHFQETFDFNDAQVSVIKSLEIIKGEYSEFFYLQDEKQAILRLIPEPLSYQIATTDANDKVKLRDLRKEKPELSEMKLREHLAFGEDVKNV